jgi:hypothetical protein
VGLEWDPLSLMSISRELLRRNSSGSGLEIREYSRRDVTLTAWHLQPQKLALTLMTSGGHSVDIVRSRTQATEFGFSDIAKFLFGMLGEAIRQSSHTKRG